jgi:hypothetical protein
LRIFCYSLINHYSNNEWSDDDNNYNFDEINCL